MLQTEKDVERAHQLRTQPIKPERLPHSYVNQMPSHRIRRIGKELADIRNDSHLQVVIIGKGLPGSHEALLHLDALFAKPAKSPYVGKLVVNIKLPENYPFGPPVMKLVTKMRHPLVDFQTGTISLDVLTTWSPVFTIKSALRTIEALFTTPEPGSLQDDNLECAITNLGSRLTDANCDFDSYRAFSEMQRHPVTGDNGNSPAHDHPRGYMASVLPHISPPPPVNGYPDLLAEKPYEDTFKNVLTRITPGRKKASMLKSCDRCRTMKNKCQGDGQSTCMSCRDYGVACSYDRGETYPVNATVSQYTVDRMVHENDVIIGRLTSMISNDFQARLDLIKTPTFPLQMEYPPLWASRSPNFTSIVPEVHGLGTTITGNYIDKIDSPQEPQFDPQSELIEVDLGSMRDLLIANKTLISNRKQEMNSEDNMEILDVMIEDTRRLLRRTHIPLARRLTLKSKKTRDRNVLMGQTKSSKIKLGLSGYLNATKVSAIADTGSAQNVISAVYASQLKLPIQHASSYFKLGNSKLVQSIGTTTLAWAFAEDLGKKYDLLFHVLPICTYDVILGNPFLTATETLSKYVRRLTKCVFSVSSAFRFGFLGNKCQRLRGVLDDVLPVLAVPDTGAERNVMDAWYAKSHGFDIKTGPETQNFLQFADGSYQETVGQVTAVWTFASGKTAKLTFEVLEDCASEVIIGEEFILKHKIFAEHASSLRTFDIDSDSYELAPFDFISSWQQKYLNLKSKLGRINTGDALSPQNSSVPSDPQSERLRRDVWNHKFEFGSQAPPEELQAEAKRRRNFEMSLQQADVAQQGGQIFRVPTMSASSSGAWPSNRAATASVTNFSRPHAR